MAGGSPAVIYDLNICQYYELGTRLYGSMSKICCYIICLILGSDSEHVHGCLVLVIANLLLYTTESCVDNA